MTSQTHNVTLNTLTAKTQHVKSRPKGTPPKEILPGDTQRDNTHPQETLSEGTHAENTGDKKGRFVFSAKKYFLTFPKVTQPVTNESVIALLNKSFPDELKSLLVARELHEDGTPHFHIYLEFKKKKQIRSYSFFDFIFNKHGNYQTVRFKKAVINYISKTGNVAT
jgi:hypothetical protein